MQLLVGVDAYGGTYYTQTVEEVNPQIFAWLDLLDMNVWVILFYITGLFPFREIVIKIFLYIRVFGGCFLA